jgi:pimeloyl-ACP methyl ester carboxylesterase
LAGSGFPLVLVPGVTLDGSFWRRTGHVDALADAFACVLVDSPGIGRSRRPDEAGGYGVRRRAADVLAIVDGLDADRFAFWGGVAGGALGRVLAADAPDRMAALVLCGDRPSDDPEAEVAAMRGLAGYVRERGDNAAIVRELCAAEGIPESHWMTTVDHGDAEVVARLVEGFAEYDWERATPGRLRVPTLVLAGEFDDSEGAAGAAAAAMADGRAVTLPGLGHVGAQLAVAETVAHARPFLLEHAA